MKSAEQLIAQGAGYALAVKANRQQLYEEISNFFQGCEANDFRQVDHDYYEETDKGHGRLESRRYWLTEELVCIGEKDNWVGSRCIGMVENETHQNGKVS